MLDIVPMETDTEIAFGDAIGDETDLSGVVIENMYITLDEENGDGYSEEEGCLVIANTMTEEQLESLLENGMNAQEVQDNFNGIILEVPAGCGAVIITAQTGEGRALGVKVGDNDAQQFAQTEMGEIIVSYEVDEPQYVYVYATDTTAPQGRRRVQGTTENIVKIYNVKWTQDDVTGITTTAQSIGIATESQSFMLDGKPIATLRKGINIIRYSDGTNKKVMVK